MLAEDDNDMGRLLIKALENAGFQGLAARQRGMSAYQRLREKPFEILGTDIVIPEMDGIQTGAPPRIRNSTPTSRSCSSPAPPLP